MGWCCLSLILKGPFLWSVFQLCIYLSDWLLVKKEWDGRMMQNFRPLLGLGRCGGSRLQVMYGGHARRLELGKMEAKFVLHPSKGGCGQTVAPDVVCVDGRKL